MGGIGFRRHHILVTQHIFRLFRRKNPILIADLTDSAHFSAQHMLKSCRDICFDLLCRIILNRAKQHLRKKHTCAYPEHRHDRRKQNFHYLILRTFCPVLGILAHSSSSFRRNSCSLDHRAFALLRPFSRMRKL